VSSGAVVPPPAGFVWKPFSVPPERAVGAAITPLRRTRTPPARPPRQLPA
jgi:hypothetical protein